MIYTNGGAGKGITRRYFLRTAGLSTAAVTLNPLEVLAQLSQQIPDSNEPLINQVLRMYNDLRSSGNIQQRLIKNYEIIEHKLS